MQTCTVLQAESGSSSLVTLNQLEAVLFGLKRPMLNSTRIKGSEPLKLRVSVAKSNGIG